MAVLNSKVALVTGGGSGIGRASALALAREGAIVVVADVNARGGEETCSLIGSASGAASFIMTDVSVAPEVSAMIERIVERHGRLDCAFNNAGIMGAGFVSTADIDEADWDSVIRVNLKGIWLCMKYELPQMVKQGGGAIVNTSSVAGLVGSRGGAAYVASKHGVVGLTKAAALEYAQANIRVNAVCPGWTQTPLTEPYTRDNPERLAQMMARQPGGRFCTPEEVAQAVVWLCSDAASFVNGHALPVDGGVVAQ
ncbi:MAG TPA: glucose 1-dehydrogenase [Anaerolineae bacterium]|jgi:NAD(P)-dependent dehydrogenase (short-subunit alcohol dehydrogenase family)